jgi:hypothetical protein
MRIISGPDGKIKGYRLPHTQQRGGQVDIKDYFDLFPAERGDVAHDLDVPTEYAPMLTRSPLDALKRLKIDVTRGRPILQLG